MTLYANNIDPFFSAGMYCDQMWFDAHEKRFKNWFNALFTPPEHLSSNTDVPMDIASVWQVFINCNINIKTLKNILYSMFKF